MTFRISGLDPAQFAPLFGLDDDALAALGARGHLVGPDSGIPDRIELRDANEGEAVILLNYVHQPADTAYRASHAIFVLEGAVAPANLVDEIPSAMATRLISLRAFSPNHELVSADVAQGVELAPLISTFFGNPAVSYIHAHYAKPGCYAAKIERA